MTAAREERRGDRVQSGLLAIVRFGAQSVFSFLYTELLVPNYLSDYIDTISNP